MKTKMKTKAMNSSITVSNGVTRKLLWDRYNNVTLLRVTSMEEEEECRSRQNVQYQLVDELNVGDIRILRCFKSGEIEIYNINLCMKIIVTSATNRIKYYCVGGDVFVEIEDEDKDEQRIFDSTGSLVASVNKYQEHLEVIFSGTGPCIKRTSRMSGHSMLYSMDGYLVAI